MSKLPNYGGCFGDRLPNQSNTIIMKKTILSAFGAFISFLCAVVNIIGFYKSDEDLFVILALLFGAASFAFVGYGIEDTQIFDFLSNFFSEKGGER